jgi:hypothetical protein
MQHQRPRPCGGWWKNSTKIARGRWCPNRLQVGRGSKPGGSYTMCGRPLGFKGFAWRLAAGRKRSCVRPVGAATWPLAQMGSASKRQTTARPRGATGINGVSCLSVRPSFISSCPYTPGTGTRLRRRSADADTPRRAPSSPTRCGRSCWPTPRRPACVACGRTTPAARRTTCLA